MRVGVINRYDGDKRRRYPFGPALRRLGATYVPVDVRDLRARVSDKGPSLTVAGRSGSPETPFEHLDLDAVLWRVSENAFTDYHSIVELIEHRHPVINNLTCLWTCSDKWRTAVALASAGISVVPTTLVLPGMAVPHFTGRRTLLKPRVGASGRGVRTAEAGAPFDLTEPHLAQPLIEVPAEEHVRAIVCGFEPVAAMHRKPGSPASSNDVTVNNIEAGGTPVPAALAPVRELAETVARCLGGDILGVDLVPWAGTYAVLEVNSSPGLTGIAQVADTDLYLLAAQAVLDRLRHP